MLSSGRQKWLQLLESISTREEAVAGGVAIAAAFATFLGPYSFTFRRDMLTVHWPQCLDERGVMLVVDSSGPYAGAEVFLMEKLQDVRSSSAKSAKHEQEEAEGLLDENGNEDESKEQDEQNGNFSYSLLVVLIKHTEGITQITIANYFSWAGTLTRSHKWLATFQEINRTNKVNNATLEDL